MLSKEIKNKRIIYFILMVLWMIIIFLFSHQNGNESSSLSDTLLKSIMEMVYPNFFNLDTITQVRYLYLFGFIIRKMAHMSEYAILYGFIYLFISTFAYKSKSYYYLFPLVIAFLYACSDEFHQYFIGGRNGSFIDVLIDTSGAFVMLLSIYVMKKYLFIRKSR